MEHSTSVSKGCFAYPVAAKGKKATVNSPLNFSKEPWFNSYTEVWKNLVTKLETLEDDLVESLLNDVLNYIDLPSDSDIQIPTAAILTGINLPDHGSLFTRLKYRLIGSHIAAGVAILNSADCGTIKHTVERVVSQLVQSPYDSEEEMSGDDEDEVDKAFVCKKNQCTLPNLVKWYNEESDVPSPSKKKKAASQPKKKKLVIILKDFETFKPTILSVFTHILSGYLPQLPLVFVFGIATTLSAINQLIPHSGMSRLSFKAFQAQPSVYFLNNTLNKIFLTPDCPFQLSGKLFKFFTQVFLFYDFSVNRFTQGLKYCLMEHFRVGGNATGLLCCPEKNIKGGVDKLQPNAIESIRKLTSFKRYVESLEDKEKRNKLLSDDSFTKAELVKLMTALRLYIKEFYITLSLLYSLVAELPQHPLGKQLRELYCVAMCKDVWLTPEYKECKQLLGYLSKAELVEKIKKMIDILETASDKLMNGVQAQLQKLLESVQDAGVSKITKSPIKSPAKTTHMVKNRAELKQKVFELGNRDSSKSQYEIARDRLLSYIMDDLFPSKLRTFTQLPLWELITLSETEARYRVVPRMRAPIHTALNNPVHYLMCDCCKINEDSEILPTMPDLCIAYKLHLESGSLINMYDWLQSFNVLVNNGQVSDEVDLKIQARFTQAVSELEFLGFIKSSKKKTDHVARLTWGGCTT